MKTWIGEIIDKATFFIRKAGNVQKEIKKAAKVKKDLAIQAEVGHKLDQYIEDFLTGKIAKAAAKAKKPELIGKKIIWQFWQQGIDENTPQLVKVCLDSVQRHRNGYEVIVLSKNTLNDYVDELPSFVWDKFGTGGFDFPKIANLVRLQLLSAYGGVWLDSTIYLTGPLDERWLDQDFFALQRSDTPPPDASLYNKRDPFFFNWDPQNQVRILNSFIVAKPHHKIVDDLLSIHLAYWQNEPQIHHYFFFQILFNRMVLHPEWKPLNCEIIGHTDCHKLQIIASEKFDRRVYEEAIARSNIHKLSLYITKKKILKGSFADVILHEKNKS